MYGPINWGGQQLKYEDLWGDDPSTGQPFTVANRRNAMESSGIRSRGMNILPDTNWDNWFDKYNQGGAPQIVQNGPVEGLQQARPWGLGNNQAQMSPGGQTASYPVKPPGPLTPPRPRTQGAGAERGTPISPEEIASLPRTGPQPWEPLGALKGLQQAAGRGAQLASQGLQQMTGPSIGLQKYYR